MNEKYKSILVFLGSWLLMQFVLTTIFKLGELWAGFIALWLAFLIGFISDTLSRLRREGLEGRGNNTKIWWRGPRA